MDLKELGLQRVSFNEKQRLDNIIAKEGDSGTRGLLVEFEEGLDCMCYMKMNGAIYEIEGVEVEEGLYEVIYPSNLKRGIVKAEIKFYKGKEILSSHIFDIKVKRNLFNLKDGITIVDEVNLADEEVIETTVEYYDEFERVGDEWGRNLVIGSNYLPMNNSDNGNNHLTLVKQDENGEDYFSATPVNNGNIYSRGIRFSEPRYEGKIYTLSFDIMTTQNSNWGLYFYTNSRGNLIVTNNPSTNGKWERFTYTFTQESTKDDNILFGFHQLIAGEEISWRKLKLEKGSQATPWRPAPEDLNNLKGKQYNLSTTLKKDQYYTLSVEGAFGDDFVGVWLGTDKFIGYLQDNKITFKVNEQLDDDYIIVKSLKEEGTINSISIKEV